MFAIINGLKIAGNEWVGFWKDFAPNLKGFIQVVFEMQTLLLNSFLF